jgi:hypothetical protein
MQAVKIIIGILLVLGALGNLRGVGDIHSRGELTGYMAVTVLFFVIGAFLLYSALKPKDVKFKLTDDDES